MKICLINSLYSPYYRGGAEVVVENIAKEFLKLNHEVVLITLGRRPGFSREGRLTIYRLRPLNVFSFLNINKRPIWLRVFWHPLDVFNLSSYFAVKKILRLEKPKVVMTHNLKGLGYLIPLAIKKLKIKHIHTVHDVQLSRPSGLILFGQEKPFLIIDKVYEKICRRLFGNPSLVISPSQWLMQYYTVRGFFYESKKEVIANPIVFRKVEKIIETPQTKEKLTMLYVGQLEKYKGILFLIETAKKLKPENWQLLIIGSGAAKAEAEKLIGSDPRFKLIGWLDSEKVIDYYRQADLTIVPSFCYENSPTVIYESLVANVPVVASDIGGIPEIVKDDYNGFTFAPANEKSLIEVLEHFLAHPENIASLKNNCFVSVRNFSVSNYLKKLMSLI
ncbi:MAG: glycosyltransferase family 4 protein [Candidatus Buchananbacteria bacterium]